MKVREVLDSKEEAEAWEQDLVASGYNETTGKRAKHITVSSGSGS